MSSRSNKALVLDTNPAVQTVVALALEALSFEIVTPAEDQSAIDAALQERPTVIVSPMEISGTDPISFAKTVHEKFLPPPCIVLLCPANQLKQTKPIAESVGIQAVLSKPFRAEQLREAVKAALQVKLGELLIVSTERLIGEGLAHLVRNVGFEARVVQSAAVAQSEAEKQKFFATIVDSNAAGEFDWFDAESMGKLCIYKHQDENLGIAAKSFRPTVMTRPLTFEKVAPALSDLLGRPVTSGEGESLPEPLTTTEQAKLAAKISATIFEFLIKERALRDRNWKEAAQISQRETLRICDAIQQVIDQKTVTQTAARRPQK